MACSWLTRRGKAWKPSPPDGRGVGIAGWPVDRTDQVESSRDGRNTTGHVALIADTCPLDPPERLEEFSSHRLLWKLDP